MITLGYKLSSEEQSATDLVRYAQMAQDTGFTFALISDHFHPWTARQGQSPFVWSVLGAIAQATQRLTVGTAVTCPSMRIHPAIIAQAAATTATLMPGRFFLGVGTDENLNEHVVGQKPRCARPAWRRPSRSYACCGRAATRAITAGTSRLKMRGCTPCPMRRLRCTWRWAVAAAPTSRGAWATA
jgi:hypothetical protein